MNKWIGLLSIPKGIGVWCALGLALLVSSVQANADCEWVKGMYVSLNRPESASLLGDQQQETALLEFAAEHGFNYLILYDLEGLQASGKRAEQLARFISTAKKEYGIARVGAALGSKQAADNIIRFNLAHTKSQHIDVLNLEYEFWNKSNREQAFEYSLSVLDYFAQLASRYGMLSEVYIGWITPAEGEALAKNGSRILLHYYRHDDVNIIDYGLERMAYLASAGVTVDIAPIFSNEGPDNSADPSGYFMGPWLAKNGVDKAFLSWIQQYQQLDVGWKSNLHVFGSSWFLYNHFADIQFSPTLPEITDTPSGRCAP
ncbi:hypothetical protein [Neptunicella sp. SCSIO 80796]|uniref:hypothetical protein n=1 Tax=Neptunicella plasticusilytica TaxID=3117012 RepID=UPI003A4D7DD4